MIALVPATGSIEPENNHIVIETKQGNVIDIYKGDDERWVLYAGDRQVGSHHKRVSFTDAQMMAFVRRVLDKNDGLTPHQRDHEFLKAARACGWREPAPRNYGLPQIDAARTPSHLGGSVYTPEALRAFALI